MSVFQPTNMAEFIRDVTKRLTRLERRGSGGDFTQFNRVRPTGVTFGTNEGASSSIDSSGTVTLSGPWNTVRIENVFPDPTAVYDVEIDLRNMPAGITDVFFGLAGDSTTHTTRSNLTVRRLVTTATTVTVSEDTGTSVGSVGTVSRFGTIIRLRVTNAADTAERTIIKFDAIPEGALYATGALSNASLSADTDLRLGAIPGTARVDSARVLIRRVF